MNGRQQGKHKPRGIWIVLDAGKHFYDPVDTLSHIVSAEKYKPDQNGKYNINMRGSLFPPGFFCLKKRKKFFDKQQASVEQSPE